MALYESVFIARQDLTPAQVETLATEVSEIIQKNGGKVTKTEQWGLRSLTYRIKKNKKGYYVLLNIDGPSVAVQEMERSMRIHDDVLRYLTVRVNELEEGPSIVMRKSNDDERPQGAGGRFDREQGGGFRPRPNRAPRNKDEGEAA